MTTPFPPVARNPNAQPLINGIHKWLAELNSKTVEIDIDAPHKPGCVTVKGDLGSKWTHGGWAEVTSQVVPVEKLSNLRAVAEDGTVIFAKGS